eukprot:jgi/Botrbrau1/1146/Bobra.0162s0037.1
MLTQDGGKKCKKKNPKNGASSKGLEVGVQLLGIEKKKRALADIAEAKALIARAKAKKHFSLSQARVEQPIEQKAKHIAGTKDDLFGQDAYARSGRRTDDGLPVYTEDELHVGKGGGTNACPFDCDCCY